jgi:hypothetical protein
MEPLTPVGDWAVRACLEVVPADQEVRYRADLGRIEWTEAVRGPGAQVHERDISPPGPPVLLVEAPDRLDVARFLVFEFARRWLDDALRVRLPFGRFDRVDPPPLRVVEGEGGNRVIGSDGALRATFGPGVVSARSAARFTHYADLPLQELSDRLERAGLAAADAVRRGHEPGSLERVGRGLRRVRQLVV